MNHQTKAALLASTFIHRSTVAVLLNGSPTPATPDDLNALLLTHVAGSSASEAGVSVSTKKMSASHIGRFRVGAYVQGDDDLCRWACVDIDGGGDHKRAVEDPLAAALTICERASAFGLPPYLEKSGGGKGWHVWLFFEKLLTCEQARLLALGLVPAEIKLESGGYADPALNAGVEVFPKAFKPRETGNMVWLPWWSEAKPGGAKFFDPFAEQLLPFEPREFGKCSEDAVTGALAALPTVDHWTAVKPAKKAKKGKGGDEAKSNESSNKLADWKKEALSKLDLSLVYAPHLVQVDGDGEWLSCHNPFNPPDKEPSAGVATGRGEAQRGSFHSFHDEKTVDVFDFLVKVGTCKTIGAAFRFVADATGIPMPSAIEQENKLPKIFVGESQFKQEVDRTWEVISDANSSAPALFFGNGGIVDLFVATPDHAPLLRSVERVSMRHHISRFADWYKSGTEVRPCQPPREICEDLIAHPRADILPPLNMVLTGPAYDNNGELCQPGYNRSLRAFYAPLGFELPEVPKEPTDEEIAGALDLLFKHLLVDFPFAAESDRTLAVSLLLLPFVRSLIHGPCPLYVVESPTEGAGKGLLLQIASIISTGSDAPIGPLSEDEDEIKKVILSKLMAGAQFVFFDNANSNTRKVIDSAALEGALTSTLWVDRALGGNVVKNCQNHAIWAVTGVNLLFGKGIRRRRVRIRISPDVEDPWKRSKFTHPQPAWSKQERRQLTAALLTLVNHWLAQGRPKASRQLGSFYEWSDIVGGIVECAGLTDWLAFLDEAEEQITEDGKADWYALVVRWWKLFGSRELTVGEVNKVCEGDAFSGEEPLLVQWRRGETPRGQQISLGKELLRRRGQIFGKHRIVCKIDPHSKRPLYVLEQLDTNSDQAKNDVAVQQVDDQKKLTIEDDLPF